MSSKANCERKAGRIVKMKQARGHPPSCLKRSFDLTQGLGVYGVLTARIVPARHAAARRVTEDRPVRLVCDKRPAHACRAGACRQASRAVLREVGEGGGGGGLEEDARVETTLGKRARRGKLAVWDLDSARSIIRSYPARLFGIRAR